MPSLPCLLWLPLDSNLILCLKELGSLPSLPSVLVGGAGGLYFLTTFKIMKTNTYLYAVVIGTRKTNLSRSATNKEYKRPSHQSVTNTRPDQSTSRIRIDRAVAALPALSSRPHSTLNKPLARGYNG